jgi:uncharacterized protein (DUF433 family)
MTMNLVIEPRPVPLTQDEEGGWRVTGTRIPLERIIECHREGLAPEAIVESFDSLRLADVYVVISYYLDHKEEVAEYLRTREEKAEAVRRMIEAGQPARPEMRKELLARKARREGSDASAGE